jgi:hypothetical protein
MNMASVKVDPGQGITTILPKAHLDEIQEAPSEKKDCDDIAVKEGDKPNETKGARFALLYLCILLGSFFTGYVRDLCPKTIRRMSS